MHRVVVVALEDVVAFDLAIPCETFGRTRLASGEHPYEVRVCGLTPSVRSAAFTLSPRYGLRALARADTIILPGIEDVGAEIPEPLIRALRSAAKSGTRIASICSGAFIFAASGLLDGRRATTHWLAAAELQRRHPAIDVDPNVLYVDEGQFLTSAGAAAGLDLCMHMVRRDFGAAVAADIARMSVMPLERAGGQSQFIVYAPPDVDGASLAPVLRWIEDSLREPLTLGDIAQRAALSVRTLNRRFREQMGTTPLRWVHKVRVQRAQELLETTGLSIEEIACAVGFSSASPLRERFRRLLATNPQAYRRAFRAPGARPVARETS
ncbi:MAG: helix-turn-helix domain-containing protein [Polyangiales bacterium]